MVVISAGFVLWVPQGKVLSPILLNLYAKLLGEVIRCFGIECH